MKKIEREYYLIKCHGKYVVEQLDCYCYTDNEDDALECMDEEDADAYVKEFGLNNCTKIKVTVYKEYEEIE